MKKTKIKRNTYEYERCLVVNTGHASRSDAELLDKAATGRGTLITPSLIVYRYEEGYFVYTHPSDPGGHLDTVEAMRRVGYSDALINLLRLAHRKRCKWLHLDRDGPAYAELPTFDW